LTRQTVQPSRDVADYAFVHRVRTRFAETDAMGVVHHAAYLPYLEEARVEYLRAIGHPYHEVRGAERAVGGDPEDGREFPVLEAWVEYRKPLVFDDEVDVALAVAAASRATFQIAYLLAVGDEVRALAVTVHGCVDRRGRAARLPGWVKEVSQPATEGRSD
jgi:acyl-CoA thioester hydrolase